MFLILLNYAVLALSFPVAKVAVSFASPTFIIGLRMILAGVILLGVVRIIYPKEFVFNWQDRWLFFKASLFHVYFAFVLEFWALSQPSISSSKTNLIYTSTPFITALLAYVLLSEKMSKQKWLGMAVGLAGLVPIMLIQADPFEAGREVFRLSLPECVLLVAVCSAAYAWFIIKQLIDRGYVLLMINGVAMSLGGVFALVTSWYVDGIYPLPVHDWNKMLLAIAGLITLSNGVFYNLYGYLMKRHSLTFLSFAGFSSPIFGAFYGWALLGEQITWHYYASLAVVICGLYIFYRDDLSKIRV